MATTDELAAIMSPCLGELLLIVLPDENDDRLRVIDGALEARIWNGKRGAGVMRLTSQQSVEPEARIVVLGSCYAHFGSIQRAFLLSRSQARP